MGKKIGYNMGLVFFYAYGPSTHIPFPSKAASSLTINLLFSILNPYRSNTCSIFLNSTAVSTFCI